MAARVPPAPLPPPPKLGRRASSSASASASKPAPSRRRQYVEMMHHRAMHQVNECLAVCLHSPRSEDKWAMVKRDKSLELFARKSNTTRSVFFLGMNEIHCAFEEVYELLNYQSTAQFRLVMKLLYGRNFRDGALMSTHAPRDYDGDYDVADVQHSALWFTLQATRESIVGKDNMLSFFQALMVLHPDRSFTTAGTSSTLANTLVDAAAFPRPSENIQKRTLALAWLPFYHADEMADVQESMRLKYTLIIEEVARHRLRLSCIATSYRDGDDLHQLRSSSAAKTIAKRLVHRSISRLETAVIASRISGQTIVLKHQWVKNEDRVQCVICWKAFNSLIRRRHHCRLCGEVICGSCSSLRSTNVVRHDRKLEKVRVCHMCSNRGGGGIGGPQHRHRRSNSFALLANAPETVAAQGNGASSTAETVGVGNDSRSRWPILERGRGDREDEDDDEYALGQDTGGSAGTGGHFGYIGAIMGAVSSTSQKLISLRSMTRADLIARSNSTSSSWKQSESSNGSSAQNAVRRRTPELAAPPPRFIGGTAARATAPNRSPPPPLPPQHGATYFGPVRGLVASPAAPPGRSQAEIFSKSFLHPSVSLPENIGSMSIVADVGSHDRSSMYANPASHERPSFGASNAGSGKTECEENSVRGDHLRRTSMTSIGLLDGYRTSDSDSKMGTVAAIANVSEVKLDAARENRRLNLMRMICSPACTLVDRVLMRECCEIAAMDCGVRGAFIARVEETYVVLEHVVGTANLSAIDHYLRADTPCDFVLATPSGDKSFCVLDCTADARTSGMVMVKDLGMTFFAGASITVRGLPIACLCVFSEDEHHVDPERSSAVSVSQYEFHVLEAAAERISFELERLVHGMDIS